MRLSTRLTIAMVALVVLTAAAVGLLTYRNIETALLPRAFDRLELQTELLATRLEASVAGARADVAGFRASNGLDRVMRASLSGGLVEGSTLAQWRLRLGSRFAAELAAKTNYAQFRVIGVADGGREIVRVERRAADGMIRMVPDGELRQVGDEAYFQRANRLPDGAIHVSPVELSRDRGVIETPPLPVLRAATPIHAADGQTFGIVIIDVDMRPAFARVRASMETARRFFVVNERGDYLVHPDPAREFGFERGTPFGLQDDFPDLAPALVSDRWQPEVTRDRSGASFGAAVATVRLAQGPRVSVIETAPYSELLASARTVRDASLLVGLAAVVCAIGLAVFLARSMTRPLVQMTRAAEGFARGEPMTVPTGAAGEIGVLARSFARMADEVTEKTAAMRRNAEMLDKTIIGMADPVIVADASATALVANPAALKIFGGRPAFNSVEWQSTTKRHLLDGVTELSPRDAPIVRALRGEVVDNQEFLFRRGEQGTTFHLIASGRPIRDQGGDIVGAAMVFRDMTVLKDTERQLRQAQKMDAVGQLTGGVAHDFNNILTVITGTIEILIEGVADRPKLAALARMIDEAATRGADLTRQLLAFSRRQPLQPRATDVNALVVETAQLLRPTLGEHIEIESMLEDAAWRAMIDPTQLSTALLNLAVNARDAMPPGGKLTLETDNVILDEAYAQANPEARPGPYVMVAVSDTGIGIPAAIREKVFEPFFTTKEVGKGTGLGLSMVYGFVKQSGGHIKIYSEEGHGTTIKLYLPRAEEAGDPPVEAPAAAPQGGSERILVVEDDELVRKHVVAQIASLGYATLAAANAAEALALAEWAEFDLLFTDVIMPGGMNGRELADEMMRRHGPLRVLYTSGYTENAIIHHGRLDSGVALLNKPYRKADLAQKIRDALAAPPCAA